MSAFTWIPPPDHTLYDHLCDHEQETAGVLYRCYNGYLMNQDGEYVFSYGAAIRCPKCKRLEDVPCANPHTGMTINNKFSIGQFVYLTTDTDRLRRAVVGIKINPNNGLSYLLVCGEKDSWHYELEISDEKSGNIAGFKK